MPRVKIKQLDERVATQGLHMGGGPERRKLEPGEVIDIAEDFLLPDGQALLEVLWQTGKLEMTLDAPTRPLDYASYREGKLCSPTCKPRDVSETAEMEKARAAVAVRILKTESDAPLPADSPAEDVPDSEPMTAAVDIPSHTTAKNRRAERRAALKAAQRGAEILT
jgi:uncharacterized Zn finger protein (UPF0148 family)